MSKNAAVINLQTNSYMWVPFGAYAMPLFYLDSKDPNEKKAGHCVVIAIVNSDVIGANISAAHRDQLIDYSLAHAKSSGAHSSTWKARADYVEAFKKSLYA